MLFRNDKKDNNLPAQVVPLLPLRGLAVFPHETFPISMGRHKSIKALEQADAREKPNLLAPQKVAKDSEQARGERGSAGVGQPGAAAGEDSRLPALRAGDPGG